MQEKVRGMFTVKNHQTITKPASKFLELATMMISLSSNLLIISSY